MIDWMLFLYYCLGVLHGIVIRNLLFADKTNDIEVLVDL